jgi:hypothetical protein
MRLPYPHIYAELPRNPLGRSSEYAPFTTWVNKERLGTSVLTDESLMHYSLRNNG